MPACRFRRLSSLDEITALRLARMKALAAPPELFVELRVRRSVVHAIEVEGTVGYLATHAGTLTELFLVPEHMTQAGVVIEESTRFLDLKRAWVCTFDPIALAACTSVSRPYTVLGLSFRSVVPAVIPTPHPLPSERVATSADVERVHEASHPEVFDDAAEASLWVANGWVTLFELPGEVSGLGLCTPIGPLTLGCDIGVRVCPAHQRRGLGAWIIQRMIHRARSQGLVPTAGCAVGNESSRRTLERAGFVADHRLLQFEL